MAKKTKPNYTPFGNKKSGGAASPSVNYFSALRRSRTSSTRTRTTMTLARAAVTTPAGDASPHPVQEKDA